MLIYHAVKRAYISSIVQNKASPTPPGRPEVTVWTTVPPGAPVGVRVYGSKRAGGREALVIHFHGGAFISGGLDTGEPMARLLAEAGSVVVSVDYPLAPVHPFPQAVKSGYAVLEWAWKHRVKLAGTQPRIFLAGEEAGGNLAAAVALVARDHGHPPLAGQILVSPMLDPCMGTASLREAIGTATQCKWSEGWQKYLPCAMDTEHPYAVPGATLRLAGLPPTLVLTGEDDPMRDEAERYASRLKEAGIPVRFSLLQATTGWPGSLTEPETQRCPCEDNAREELAAFVNPATPPPPDAPPA
jgi:acetyl esterase/lipase